MIEISIFCGCVQKKFIAANQPKREISYLEYNDQATIPSSTHTKTYNPRAGHPSLPAA